MLWNWKLFNQIKIKHKNFLPYLSSFVYKTHFVDSYALRYVPVIADVSKPSVCLQQSIAHIIKDVWKAFNIYTTLYYSSLHPFLTYPYVWNPDTNSGSLLSGLSTRLVPYEWRSLTPIYDIRAMRGKPQLGCTAKD